MKKKLYVIVGSIALGLGVIGIFLPLLPTTPFLLLAAFCFERGSEKIHKMMMENKHVAPYVNDWQKHRRIKPRAKILATFFIGSSVFFIVTNRDIAIPIQIGVVVFLALVNTFILTRKN